MSELGENYERKLPALLRAAEWLRSILDEVGVSIEDKTLVRAEVRNVRPKELSELERKAEKKGWSASEALTHCGDLIGGRVVCNNVEDVYRFTELLKERLPSVWGEFEVQDYIKKPTEEGYRALHVNFRLDVGEHPFHPDFVPCEVQIRSRLQDAWAELSHDDIYKQPHLPKDLRARAMDLAKVLAAADEIANDIRSRAGRETLPPHQRPDLSRVSVEGLAFVFKDVFGRSPPDYAVRQALNVCDKFDVTSLERFPEVLGRTEFRNKLANAHRTIFPVPLGMEDLFLASLYALARGDDQAVTHVRREARRARREIEAFARREVLGELPEDPDDFLEQLDAGQLDVELVSSVLGGATKCAVCGEGLAAIIHDGHRI